MQPDGNRTLWLRPPGNPTMLDGMLSTRTLACLLALTTAAAAQVEILRNDSAEPGSEIAFYPRFQSEESFRVILDAPAWARYRICRLYAWIGPEDFNVFEVRIGEADEAGGESALIWQADDDAFQMNGSRQALNAIDLRLENIVTEARRLRIRITHAAGFPAPPTIATDTDGITPGRNQIAFLMRGGNVFDDFTEALPVDGNNPRPPGDWIVRAQVVEADDVCPERDGPDPRRDAAVDPPDPLDAFVPRDAGPERDADPERDARPRRDAAPPRDAAPEHDADHDPQRDAQAPGRDAQAADAQAPGRDAGRGDDRFVPGGLAVERISPVAGTADRNTDVVINGRGFPFGAPVRAFLGDTRLLEATVLSESTLTAIAPAGMAPGLYDLRVEREDGQAAILPDAYSVVARTGAPAEDDCGCDLTGRAPPPAALLLVGLLAWRFRGRKRG